MRILLITFDPPQNVGGIEGRGKNYTKYLPKLGHFVEVISFYPGNNYSTENLHGSTMLNFPSSSKNVLKNMRLTSKEISKNSIDSIFVLSGALTLYGLLLMIYARWKRIRILAFYYGKDILTARERLSSAIALWLSPRIAPKIAVNSHYTEKLLPKSCSKKISVLYPSVDPKIVDEAQLETDSTSSGKNERTEQNNSEVNRKVRTKVILFVGRLVRRKGVDDLLSAFKSILEHLPDSRLEIVGDGPELGQLQELAAKIGISDKVKFYGRRSGPPLYRRYQDCDVFVMPSKTTSVDVEGFGTVFLEAGIFGRPSVGTDSGGIPEAVLDGKTGVIIPEGDVGRLSEALERVLLNPDLANRLGKAAKERVLSQFTWEKASEQLAGMLTPTNSTDKV